MATKISEKLAISMLKKYRKFCRHGLTHLDATPIVQIHMRHPVCMWTLLPNPPASCRATLPKLSNSSFDSSENQRNNNNHQYLCQLM